VPARTSRNPLARSRTWPDDSLAQARQIQAAFDDGHMPWRSSVVAAFASTVYGWNDATVSRIAVG
jgi:hypothetical protein